jgi:hypothetical protein
MKVVISRICLFAMCAVQAAFGCEPKALELRQVSPELTIVVTHRDKPIAGMRVQVVPEKSIEPVLTATTDENGTVLIRRLTVGRYYLTAAHEDIEAGREWIEVVAVPDAKTKRRLDFQWADWSYQTSQVAGTLTGSAPGNSGSKLMDIIHPVETAYPGVDITLRSVLSDGEYRTVSDSDGSFFISNVPDGTYIMTIAGGMRSITGVAEATKLVIDVKQSIGRTSLPLQLKDTGCYRTAFELAEGQVGQTPLLKAIEQDNGELVK